MNCDTTWNRPKVDLLLGHVNHDTTTNQPRFDLTYMVEKNIQLAFKIDLRSICCGGV